MQRFTDSIKNLGSRSLEACEAIMSIPRPVRYMGALALTAASLSLNLGGVRDIVPDLVPKNSPTEDGGYCWSGGQNLGPASPETGCADR